LKELTNSALHNHDNKYKDQLQIKEAIYKLAIPSFRSSELLEKLNNCKQIHFKLTSEYVDEITNLMRKYSIAAKLGKGEALSKRDEYFKLGLSLPTRIYLNNNNTTTFVKAFDQYQYLETMILSDKLSSLRIKSTPVSGKSNVRQPHYEKFCDVQ